MIRLGFHGAAGTVTGSRFLVATEKLTVLIDCGLFQGHKELRLRNWDRPGFDPREVDAVVLTHAHIDHSGYLPRLVRDGFRGKVHATTATTEIAGLLLPDSAHIQEEDAAYANRKGFSKHHPALPLYTVQDAERALERFVRLEYGEWRDLGAHVRFRFVRAGHILGSGIVELHVGKDPLRLVFSGDVGRYGAPLVPDPAPPPACDHLVVESTYGDRDHPETPVEDQLAEALRRVVSEEGTLLAASFAVARAQQLIYLLRKCMDADPRIDVPIHLDSPMAVDTTEIYRRHPEEKGIEDVTFRSGDRPVYGRQVFLHRSVDDSKRLNGLKGPRVILSSSGMMTGGRILHHLRRCLPDPRSTVLLAGYQAPGTRGWRLAQGETSLRIHGQDVPVGARVVQISGLSAHADRDELLRWVRPLSEGTPPRTTFVTHGDPEAADALAVALRERFGFRCEVPRHGQTYEL